MFKGRALADDTLSAAGVNDGDALVGLPRREPREPRADASADQSPDEATIMAVTSEEAKRRGLPTDAASLRRAEHQRPPRRPASAMQDAIGAELLGLLEQAVPGEHPSSKKKSTCGSSSTSNSNLLLGAAAAAQHPMHMQSAGLAVAQQVEVLALVTKQHGFQREARQIEPA